jgi:molybdopterin-biosynthesis enzyme MoeA-like protein
MSESTITVEAASAPWVGYDDQSVALISRFVAKSCSVQAQTVRAYEQAHQDRGDVIAAADLRLAALPG